MKLLETNIEYEPLYTNENYEEEQKEIALWRAVIKQTLEDLNLPITNKRYRLWRIQAEQWFSPENEDFNLVCQYAKICPRSVLNQAKKLMR